MIDGKNGPRFWPGQVIESEDGDEKFIPGQVINDKFVPGIIVDKVFIPGQVLRTDNGKLYFTILILRKKSTLSTLSQFFLRFETGHGFKCFSHQKNMPLIGRPPDSDPRKN